MQTKSRRPEDLAGKRMLKSVLPPFLWHVLTVMRRRMSRSVDSLTYAPDGWETKLPADAHAGEHWTRFITHERLNCEALIARLDAGETVLTFDRREHLNYVTFGYVLALAARQKQTLRVLDYGGNLADYYWVARALLPGVAVEYHCKELPAVAEEGRKISPAVIWHTDDDCLVEKYDLIMFSSSLQYLPNWDDILRRAARAAGRLALLQVSTVEHVQGYVAVQRLRGTTNLHQQLNRSDVLRTVHSAGLRLVREFVMAEHPPVDNAPEQPAYAGWLFERDVRT